MEFVSMFATTYLILIPVFYYWNRSKKGGLYPYFGKDRLPEIGRDSFSGSAAVPVEGGVIPPSLQRTSVRTTRHCTSKKRKTSVSGHT
jgi:hypothetical protein